VPHGKDSVPGYEYTFKPAGSGSLRMHSSTKWKSKDRTKEAAVHQQVAVLVR
jgi:hypothetical protein